MRWLYFLGRFHVLMVHLPIGIICVTVALELLARRPRFSQLAAAGNFLWAAAAITAVVTASLGLMHSMEGGFNPQILARHRALGISVAVFATVLFFLRLKRPQFYHRTQLFTGPLIFLLVAVTGHYGGDLTHGPDYLFTYAPAPLQRLVGMAPTPTKKIALANAQVYADVIHPMLMSSCGRCHGEDKQKGGLSLANYRLMMEGGQDYPAIVPGSLVQSELYWRVTRPPSSEEFMPHDHKKPLSPDQIRIIAWWIKAGAPAKGTIRTLKAPPAIAHLIQRQLALPGRGA